MSTQAYSPPSPILPSFPRTPTRLNLSLYSRVYRLTPNSITSVTRCWPNEPLRDDASGSKNHNNRTAHEPLSLRKFPLLPNRGMAHPGERLSSCCSASSCRLLLRPVAAVVPPLMPCLRLFRKMSALVWSSSVEKSRTRMSSSSSGSSMSTSRLNSKPKEKRKCFGSHVAYCSHRGGHPRVFSSIIFALRS